MFSTLTTSASGLTAQRVRMDATAQNVLNLETTRDAQGRPNPYRRRFVMLAPGQPHDARQPGVHVQQVGLDPSPFRRVHEPGHADADAEGYVNYPNVDLSAEFTNMIEASRAYEANVTLMETTKSMIASTMRLLA